MKSLLSVLLFALLVIPLSYNPAQSEINNLETLLRNNSINDEISREKANNINSSRTECRENIDNIRNALMFLAEFQEIKTETLDFNQLVSLGVLTEIPQCPGGGKYTITDNNESFEVKCSKHDFSVINSEDEELTSIYSPTEEDMKYISHDPVIKENFNEITENIPPEEDNKIESPPEDEKIDKKKIDEKADKKDIRYSCSKPFSDTDPKKAYSNSLDWAKKAKAAGIHTLVISYEGLASYSKTYAKKTYAYQEALRKGLKAKKPGLTGMSFIAKYLIVPNLKKYFNKAEFLLLPETAENKKESAALKCAEAWYSVYGKDLNLIVMGHSFGGYTVLKLTKKLDAKGIPVKNALTIDARAMPQNYRYFKSPGNIQNHYNYYQKGIFMPGYSIKGANNEKVRGSSHGTMPKNPKVVSRFLMMLDK